MLVLFQIAASVATLIGVSIALYLFLRKKEYQKPRFETLFYLPLAKNPIPINLRNSNNQTIIYQTKTFDQSAIVLLPLVIHNSPNIFLKNI